MGGRWNTWMWHLTLLLQRAFNQGQKDLQISIITSFLLRPSPSFLHLFFHILFHPSFPWQGWSTSSSWTHFTILFSDILLKWSYHLNIIYFTHYHLSIHILCPICHPRSLILPPVSVYPICRQNWRRVGWAGNWRKIGDSGVRWETVGKNMGYKVGGAEKSTGMKMGYRWLKIGTSGEESGVPVKEKNPWRNPEIGRHDNKKENGR